MRREEKRKRNKVIYIEEIDVYTMQNIYAYLLEIR